MKKLILLLLVFSCGCRDVENQDHVHLQFIGLSMFGNIQAKGSIPSNITDKEGKPLLSWRVELLKYGSSVELELYKKFKLDEPWNSPHNLKVAQTVCFMYVDPKGPKCKPVNPIPNSILMTMNPKELNHTPYLGVTGPTAAFRPGNPRRYDINDPNAPVVAAVVVVDNSDVFWSEPRDIPLENVKKGDSLRWYGGKTNWYLTTRCISEKWYKYVSNQEEADHNLPPEYEFGADE